MNDGPATPVRDLLVPSGHEGALFGSFVVDPVGYEREQGGRGTLTLPCDKRTLASLLASSFPEAGAIEVEALMYAALVLLAITFIVNVGGLIIQQATVRKFEGKK